ncbi:hypothetical protein [Pantoea sp. AMG 501]|uniref:hypothetical protein n=1 Tax=Pantoea sp. AMG 501 TaxID=2008894 RepID=UPI000B5A3DEE|nr:hypothetical protein [Pantoea sp. AMG 501]OWY74370.1 hypothetical protein CDN97_23835 [Pantoea sp. AMG 501]
MIRTFLAFASQITGLDLTSFTVGFAEPSVCLKQSIFQHIIELVLDKKSRFCRITNYASILLLFPVTVILFAAFLTYKTRIRENEETPESKQ